MVVRGRRNDSRGDKNGITDFLLMLIVHIPQSNISSQSTDVVNICAPDFKSIQ